MRWLKPEKKYPPKGSTRTVRKFCWLPYKWGQERFWLETIEIREYWLEFDSPFGYTRFWTPISVNRLATPVLEPRVNRQG